MVRLILLKQKMENLIFKWPCTPLMPREEMHNTQKATGSTLIQTLTYTP